MNLFCGWPQGRQSRVNGAEIKKKSPGQEPGQTMKQGNLSFLTVRLAAYRGQLASYRYQKE
jgi:hypothetical protein